MTEIAYPELRKVHGKSHTNMHATGVVCLRDRASATSLFLDLEFADGDDEESHRFSFIPTIENGELGPLLFLVTQRRGEMHVQLDLWLFDEDDQESDEDERVEGEDAPELSGHATPPEVASESENSSIQSVTPEDQSHGIGQIELSSLAQKLEAAWLGPPEMTFEVNLKLGDDLRFRVPFPIDLWSGLAGLGPMVGGKFLLKQRSLENAWVASDVLPDGTPVLHLHYVSKWDLSNKMLTNLLRNHTKALEKLTSDVKVRTKQ